MTARDLATGMLLLGVWPAMLAGGTGLRAGAAKMAITPDLNTNRVYLAGFGNNRLATGVHDDLYVRCLALGVGQATVVMCSVDLVGLFYDDVLRIRERVKTQVPEATHLVVAATHDHEGPDTLGLWGPAPFQSGMDERYLDWLQDRIAWTATEAVRAMKEARLTLARDDHPLLAMLQSDGRPPYVKDPYLFVMRVDSAATGKALATLVNWSDHPETLGGKNTLITADYPHWLCEYLEDRVGGIAVFFNGSIGGLLTTLGNDVALQDPDTGEVARDATWRKAELFGTRIGELAKHALLHGEGAQVDSLVIRKAILFARLHNDRFRVASATGVYKGRKPLYTDGKIDRAVAQREFPGYGKQKYATGKDVQTEVDYIALRSKGRIVAEIATVPGEIYPELVDGGITRYPGADFPDAPFEPTIRLHMKSQYRFIFGLANDELGYIIPKAEWDDEPPWLKNRQVRWYGEVNSAGPDVAAAVTRALVSLIDTK